MDASNTGRTYEAAETGLTDGKGTDSLDIPVQGQPLDPCTDEECAWTVEAATAGPQANALDETDSEDLSPPLESEALSSEEVAVGESQNEDQSKLVDKNRVEGKEAELECDCAEDEPAPEVQPTSLGEMSKDKAAGPKSRRLIKFCIATEEIIDGDEENPIVNMKCFLLRRPKKPTTEEGQ